MKHKLTVLACVGLALLLSTGFAFAQPNSTITIESKDVNRCSNATVGINLINGDAIDGIGLPLKVTGGTVTAAAATARLTGWTTVQTGLPGASFLLNAVGSGPAIPPGAGNIYTLTVPIPSACTGTIEIDTAFYPPAGAVLLLSGCCPVELAFNKGVLNLKDQAPVCGTNADVTVGWQSAIVNKLLMASDPDACDQLTYSLVSSPGSIEPGTNKYSWDPGCPDVGEHTITFKATDPCGEFVTCSFKVTVTQTGPVCTGVPAQSVHFASTLNVMLPAVDDGCGTLVWTMLSEDLVGAVSINSATGLLTYVGKCADIATSPHTVTYKVSDGSFECQANVSITVTNTAPTIVCPAPIAPCNVPPCSGNTFNLGDLVTGTAVGTDANGDPLTYAIVSIKHNGVPTVPKNPAAITSGGVFTWIPSVVDTSEVGTWEFCLTSSDGCATSEPCCFSVNVEFRYILGIRGADGVSDKIYVLNGDIADVYVNITPGCPLGGFDLLIAYDQTGLSFVAPPEKMDGLETWEYFTYRTSANSNCAGGGCPTGLIRFIAIADLDNGAANHPSTYYLAGNIIHFRFKVSSNRNLIGQCLPVQFWVIDCGDNALASKDGKITYVPFGTDLAACRTGIIKDSCAFLPVVHLDDGAICVREPLDDRGDINQNGIANEVSDAVLFSNYFIYGIEATFAPAGERREAQKLATDINDDGIVLTVADLVYLIRIITGDESPFPANPKLTPYTREASAIVNVGADRVSVTTNSSMDLGGAVFTFRYSGLTVGDAVLGSAASQMVVNSKADRGELRVLVAPMMTVKGARIGAGINEILSIPTSGNGTIELVSVEMSDAQGALLTTVASKSVPTEYALLQNYPNPFNAGTVIQFGLKEATDWKLNVYNITGQTVRSFSGNGQGQVQVTWDGADNAGNAIASGVYFYRLETKAFTATKKMTLMK